MKLAKIALPIAILSLIGLAVALFTFNSTSVAPDENQLGYALGLPFIIIFTLIPMISFIPFGGAIIICELFLLFSRRKFAALTGALVLMCILLPVVLYVSYMCIFGLGQYSPTLVIIVAVSAVCYLAALVLVFINYFKYRKLHKKAKM